MPIGHLFDSWDSVVNRLKDKRVFIFLDYDGTLAPISKTPGLALMPAKTRRILARLAADPHCRVAVISGRSLDDIQRMVSLSGIIYSGNHGLEIEGPKIRHQVPMHAGYRRLLVKIKAELNYKIAGFKGVFIEDKGYSLALHYRLAQKKNVSRIMTAFHETIIIPLVENKIKIRSGKMVLEVHPPLGWDKGKVVLWLLARQRIFDHRSDVVPLYIGDDLTDEDAFRALVHIGVTVAVGKVRESAAKYYLDDPDQVTQFLTRLLAMEEGRGHAEAG